MGESSTQDPVRIMKVRHRGRISQISIYLVKMLRLFVYQNDWKVLPMSALIAGLIGLVMRSTFFVTMEGTLMGAFSLVCMCLWNGAFNSIQAVCRERDVVKREHRSGMHISSYVASHVIYQSMLCLAQTIITIVIISVMDVKIPDKGFITPWFRVDIGITLFLVTLASDMLSLWISSIARNTTTAMTIMPFVLIFQLVFSGGMQKLPEWTESLSPYTVSGPGVKAIAAQADLNNKPFVTLTEMLNDMRGSEIEGSVTLGQVLDLAKRKDISAVAELRKMQVLEPLTVTDLAQAVKKSSTLAGMKDEQIAEDMTVGDLMAVLELMSTMDQYKDMEISSRVTVGEILDFLESDPDVQANRESGITVSTTLGDLIDLAGEDNVRTYLEEKMSAASYKEAYRMDKGKIMGYWRHLAFFVLLFALLTMITLEFIDKDKR